MNREYFKIRLVIGKKGFGRGKMRTTESEDRYQVRASTNGELDKTLAALEYEAKRVRLCVQRFPSTAHDYRDASPHSLSIFSATRKQVLAGFSGYRGKSHR